MPESGRNIYQLWGSPSVKFRPELGWYDSHACCVVLCCVVFIQSPFHSLLLWHCTRASHVMSRQRPVPHLWLISCVVWAGWMVVVLLPWGVRDAVWTLCIVVAVLWLRVFTPPACSRFLIRFLFVICTANALVGPVTAYCCSDCYSTAHLSPFPHNFVYCFCFFFCIVAVRTLHQHFNCHFWRDANITNIFKILQIDKFIF